MKDEISCLLGNIKSICGGRCLYANYMQHWGESGHEEVCKTVRHLISELQDKLPIVMDLIKERKISMDDLLYTRHNSCEIIP